VSRFDIFVYNFCFYVWIHAVYVPVCGVPSLTVKFEVLINEKNTTIFQISAMEDQCSKLDTDNQSLMVKLKQQEATAGQMRQQQHQNHQQKRQRPGVGGGSGGDTSEESDSEVAGLEGELKSSEMEVRNHL
jgi:hypothetical protein